MRLLARAGVVFALWSAIGATARAQVTRLVSVSSRGLQGSSANEDPCISANGRFVAFASFSPNLVPDDTNDDIDVFVRDLQTGRTELVSVSSTGEQSNKQSFLPAISGDGRFVAFYSSATNLDPTHGFVIGEIYVRDRLNRTTQMVSVDASGHPSGLSEYPSISADGRFVAFTSYGDFGHDYNGIPDVWVRDLRNGTVECVSVPSGPAQEDSPWFTPFGVLSADGRYVVFETWANNIIPGVHGTRPNVFLRDRLTGSVELINVDLQGNPGIGGSVAGAVSADGRYVLFGSASPNLVRRDTNDSYDVFVRDRVTGTTERESVSSEGIEGDADSGGILGMTPDGRYVVFPSIADNLVPGGTNGEPQIFLHDRVTGTTELISLTSAGLQEFGESVDPSISDDERFVAFDSGARLVPGDTTFWADIYLRDRDGRPSFTSLCTPSLDGVIRCPCSNDARRGDRGCENSSGTGGAALSAIGGTFVSSDSLEFHVVGETPDALSILFQGSSELSGGVVDGQGVRCIGGAMRRLFTEHAVEGSLLVPDFHTGETTVSHRSKLLGDRIEPGQQRWYSVLYRDSNVLGGCPATSTFNSTQTGVVAWAP